MSAHTPGPWVVRYPKRRDIAGVKLSMYSTGQLEKFVADFPAYFHPQNGRSEGARHEADARLCSAAPELYEVVRAVADAGFSDLHREGWEELQSMADAALKKARGE